MFDKKGFIAIGGTGNHELDKYILKDIKSMSRTEIPFLNLDIDTFPDGESDLRIANHERIKNKHILLFQSIYNENLRSQFLTLGWAAKRQYGAQSITAIVPFMRYRRQDNNKNGDEINRNLMFIQQMKLSGIDRLLLIDIHSNITLQNCKKTNIEAWNIDPTPAFARKLRPLVDLARDKRREFYIYSPDEGSILRAASLAKELDVKMIAALKNRKHTGEVEQIDDAKLLAELSEKYGIEILQDESNIKNSSICIREDEVSTGGTANMTSKRLKQLGARETFFCFTHAVFSPSWRRKFINNSSFDGIFGGNTIHRDYEKTTGGQITKVHMSHIIATRLLRILSATK